MISSTPWDYAPHDLNAENLVLAYLVDTGERMDEAMAALNETSFFSANHRSIWCHLVEMKAAGRKSDRGTLQNALQIHRQLDDIGGKAAIDALIASLPKKRNLTEWISVVREMADRRAIIAAALKAMKDAQHEKPEAVAGTLKSSLDDIALDAGKAGTRHSAELIPAVMGSLYERSQGIVGISTGFRAIDVITRLRNGEMVVLAARSSIGKSAIAMNMATHIAVQERKKVLVFSLEMSATEIMARAVCSDAGVEIDSFCSDKADRVERACEQFKAASLRIYDKRGLSIDKLRAEALFEQRRHGIDVIVIDYLQYLRGISARKYFSREQEVADVSQGIKSLAKELGVPIVVLAQLNRGAEGHDRPSISQIRESGAIEQDADVIMLLHRDRSAQYSSESETLPAEVIIAKNRNGKTGVAELAFRPRYVRFEDKEVNTW